MTAVARYTTVLFDADNTLFDFDRAERQALRRVLEDRGYPFTPELEARYRAINQPLWQQFDAGEVELDFLLVERFRRFETAVGGDHDPAQLNRDYLTYLGEGAYLLPGAEALCRALAPHCTLAIVTNGAALAQRGRLARSPLRDCISHLFISQELGCRKPEPAFFDRVFSALGLADRSQAVVVGDSLRSDILGGIQAGVDTIWYHPARPSAPPEPRPTYTVSRLSAVRQIVLGE
jgi:YjjG family noncanonical pyrimidine nucleotidase